MKHANNAVLIIEYTVTPIRANLSLGANTINTANKKLVPSMSWEVIEFFEIIGYYFSGLLADSNINYFTL